MTGQTTLAQALQHRQTALVAGLSASSARGVDRIDLSAGWGAVRFAHASPARHILHRSELRDRCATLTIQMVQNIGQATITATSGSVSHAVSYTLTTSK